MPGPIDNSAICFIKNSQPVIKLGSDYCSISKEMYQYLLSIYGGGPDIALQPNSVPYLLSGSSVKSAVSFSACSYPQKPTVKSNSTSHYQSSCSSVRIPCDIDVFKNVSGCKFDEHSATEESMGLKIEEV